eukprot:483257-Prymnesium_polylepis.1
MALYGAAGSSPPLAYAVMADVPKVHSDALLRHDGLCVLSYDTKGHTDYSGFDQLLERLYHATNPLIRFGRVVSGRRILWVHPMIEQSSHTRYLISYLEDANRRAVGRLTVEMVVVAAASEALAKLSEGGYDCVVAVMPVNIQAPGTALELLRRIAGEHSSAHSVPVLVFGSEPQVASRRAACLRMGA